MGFGQKSGSLKNLKKSLAKGGGKGFIKYIPKNGSMNVRFIQEPEEWVNYIEHYDQVARKSFPCNGEQNCPGCLSGERKSSRYLTNAVDLDDQERVVPLQLPKDLANRLVVKYEKWGSLIDRNIELSRSGEGLDTVYDLEADPPDRKRIDKYQPLDLLQVLEDAFNSVFGEDDDDDEAPAPKKSAVRGRKKSAAASAAKGSTFEDDDEDEEEEEAPAPKPKKKGKKKPPPEPEFEEDDDEEEDDEEGEEPEEDDEEGYSLEELGSMTLGQLRAVARDEFGVSTKGKKPAQLIEEIMAVGEVEEDDEPPF